MYHYIPKLLLIFTGAAFIFFLLSECMAGVPDNLGLKNQLLSPCPGTPNCVSSQEKNSQHRIQPIIFEGSLELSK